MHRRNDPPPQVETSPIVREGWPLISGCMPFVAHVQIRNRGTLGGSLSHADPAAELPAVMTALEAKFVLRSNRATRTLAAKDFFVGMLTTAMPARRVVDGSAHAGAAAGNWVGLRRAQPQARRFRARGRCCAGSSGAGRGGSNGRVSTFTGVGERPTRVRAETERF